MSIQSDNDAARPPFPPPPTAATTAQTATTAAARAIALSSQHVPFIVDITMMSEAAFLPMLLPAAVRKALQSYHLLVMYLALRLSAASWLNDDSLLGRLAVKLSNIHPIVVLSLGMTAAAAIDEVAYILAQLRLNTKALLVAKPLTLSYEGQTCCICQDTARTVGLVSFCKRSNSHASHWDCMTSWFESGAHLSNCCPVCRGPLRLQPLPMKDRLDLVFFGNQHWRLLPNRLMLFAGSVGVVGVVLAAAFI